jgi:predicted transcriptional regulator
MNSAETTETKQPIREKWGNALDLGFVVTPSVLLRKQVEMKLDCEDVVILLNLMSKWWDPDRLPFPRTETIAKRTGLSRRTVQRRLATLEGKGLIRRVRVRKSAQEPRRITAYDLEGLVVRLQELVEDERRMRAAGKREVAASEEFSVQLA